MNRLTKLSRAIVTIVMTLAVGLPSFASFEVDGIFYNIANFTARTVAVTYKDGGSRYYGSVTIPEKVLYNGNTYYVAYIGSGAFSDCTGLTSVVIPNSVTHIGNGAFSCCTGLTSITIPNSVTYIEPGAFSGCTGLTSVTIPNSVTFISEQMFFLCSGLISVTIPNSVTSIGSSAFSGCTGLASVTIPNSVTSIRRSAFYDCSSLASITIPESVTSIGESAFGNCTGLTEVTFNAENCSTMGSSEWPVFLGCTNVTKLIIGRTVKRITSGTFAPFVFLDEIISLNPSSPRCQDDTVFDVSAYYYAKLSVPESSVEVYKNAYVWKNFSNIEVAGITDVKVDEDNATEVARYDANGRLLSKPAHGINIIKMSDGTTRKEWVK